MIEQIINRALAGLNYLLTVAVSVVVVVIAIVAFRAVLESPEASDATTSTTTTTTATTDPPARGLGSPIAATTEPEELACTSPPLRGDDRTRIVRLYFTCDAPGSQAAVGWVYREIDAEGGPLSLIMQSLVSGPTADERGAGFRSLFSPATAGAVLSVSRVDGSVTVDLRDLGPMPSLATDPEGPLFLAVLNNTLFQVDVVSSVEYRIEGSCARFWEYFGEDECRIVRRADWELSPYSTL